MKPLKPDTGSATVDAVLHAAHRVRQAADAELRTLGLSLSSYKALRALEIEPCSMRALSEALWVAPRTVTDIIDGLEKRGLVERGTHPQDRRVTLLRITGAGSVQLRSARLAVERVHRASVAALTEADQKTLVALLERIGLARSAGAASIAAG